MKLQGKVALITGGGQGIGEGIVRCLAEEGADAAIVDLNGENANRLARELETMGRKTMAIEADATKNDQVDKAVSDTLTYFGQIDILVNNVGGVSGDPAQNMTANFIERTEEEWQESYELNLKSHIIMVKAIVPHFVERGGGKIVNVASGAAKQPSKMFMPYATFKAADMALTRSLATELAGANINVNCVLPGLIYTPLWQRGAEVMHSLAMESAKATGDGSDKELEKISPKDFWLMNVVAPTTPLQREQTPEDIGKAVVFLVSEDARNITGQALSIDGGQVMH